VIPTIHCSILPLGVVSGGNELDGAGQHRYFAEPKLPGEDGCSRQDPVAVGGDEPAFSIEVGIAQHHLGLGPVFVADSICDERGNGVNVLGAGSTDVNVHGGDASRTMQVTIG
jgi:hypothetical protein